MIRSLCNLNAWIGKQPIVTFLIDLNNPVAVENRSNLIWRQNLFYKIMSASKFQIMVQHLVYNQIFNQQMQYFLHLVAQSSSVNVSSNHLYQLLYFLFIILRYWHIKLSNVYLKQYLYLEVLF